MPLTGFIDPSGDFTLTINGTNYTKTVEQSSGINIEQTLPAIPRADERRPKFEPVLAIGSIPLFADQELTVIDWEAAIASDFKAGRPIVLTTQHNTYRFRVRNYDIAGHDPETGQILGVTIGVTDKLGQINRQTKRPGINDYIQLLNSEGISPTAPIFLWQSVVKIVGQFPRKANDQPYLTSSDFSLPSDNFTDNGFLDTEAVPKGGFNAAEAIASILYARGYLCYCDPLDEVIKAHRYPLDISTETPAYRWDVRQVETFVPAVGTEEPADRVEAEVRSIKSRFRVTRTSVELAAETEDGDDATDDNAVSVDTWPKTYPTIVNGDLVLVERTDQQPSISPNRSTSSYTERARQSHAFGNTNDAFFDSEDGTIVRSNHPTFKFPISEITTKNVAKGILSPDLFPASTQKVATRLEKHWKVSNLGDGGDGILTLEYEQLWLPTSVVLDDENLSDTLTRSYEKGARYQELTPGQWIKIPYRLIADIDQLSTDLIPDPDFGESVEFIDGIPAPPTAPSDDVDEVETNSAEANGQSGEDSSGVVMRVSLTYGNRPSLAKTTAETSLALSQHNQILYDTVRTEQPTETWAPGTREDVANAAMARVGHGITIDGDGIRIRYSGLKAATLEKPITIADLDSGNAPSPTNVTPVYTSISVARLTDDLPLLSETVVSLAGQVVYVEDSLPLLI